MAKKYEYKILYKNVGHTDIIGERNALCKEIEKHEEQGWEYLAFNTTEDDGDERHYVMMRREKK